MDIGTHHAKKIEKMRKFSNLEAKKCNLKVNFNMILTNLATEGGRKNLKGGTTWSIFSHFGGWGGHFTHNFVSGGGTVYMCPPP